MAFLANLALLVVCALPGPRPQVCAGNVRLMNRSGSEIEQFDAGGGQDLLEPGTLAASISRKFGSTDPSSATDGPPIIVVSDVCRPTCLDVVGQSVAVARSLLTKVPDGVIGATR